MFELDRVPQRPLRIWLHGMALGLASFRKLIALTTVLGFLSLLPTIYMAMKFGDQVISPNFMLQLFKQGHFIFTMLMLQLSVLILSSFVNVLIIRRLDETARETQRNHELGFALHKLVPLALAYILVFITLMVGILLAAVVGALFGAVFGMLFGHAAAVVVTEICIFTALIYIAINLLFFQFAVVLDGKGPVGSLNRSCALVFRNWWRTFMVLLCTVLVIAVIVIMVLIPLAAVMPIGHWLPALTATETGRTLLIKGVLQLIGGAILAPFVLGILYMLYHDLKTRNALKPGPGGAIQA
jgi:hypothetical protein